MKSKIMHDWSKFGCYADRVKELVRLLGYEPVDPGMLVRPGMRVEYRCGPEPLDCTVAPDGTHSKQPSDGMSFWDAEGTLYCSSKAGIEKNVYYKGKPVLGYDK